MRFLEKINQVAMFHKVCSIAIREFLNIELLEKKLASLALWVGGVETKLYYQPTVYYLQSSKQYNFCSGYWIRHKFIAGSF